jgi:hypothetical protein
MVPFMKITYIVNDNSLKWTHGISMTQITIEIGNANCNNSTFNNPNCNK